jgi:hypothetical protein
LINCYTPDEQEKDKATATSMRIVRRPWQQCLPLGMGDLARIMVLSRLIGHGPRACTVFAFCRVLLFTCHLLLLYPRETFHRRAHVNWRGMAQLHTTEMIPYRFPDTVLYIY